MTKIRMNQESDVIYDIMHTRMSLQDIAIKYDVTIATISSINMGLSHKKGNLVYPLRQKFSRFTEKNDKIKFEIINTFKSFDEIAKKYNVTINMVYKINNGSRSKDNTLKYPLRQLKYITI